MNPFRGKNGIYVIAEVGGNHEGDFTYAKKLARLAAESGADAVKFQIYTGDSLVNPMLSADRHKHFQRFELSTDKYLKLAAYVRELGSEFLASIWNPESIETFKDQMPFFKVGSGDLTAFNMLTRMAATGKPIVLSTGLAILDDILEAVDFIISVDPTYRTQHKLALLQCTAMYPIPDVDVNLRVMKTLRERTGLPVGYSDHTVGLDALEAAVAMGAQIVEKHFTDCREGKEFRDHQISATRDELRGFILKARRIRSFRGSPEKRPAPSEIEAGHVMTFRRGVYPNRDLPAGQALTEEDLVTLRPEYGISAKHYYNVLGKTLVRPVKRFEPLQWDDLISSQE